MNSDFNRIVVTFDMCKKHGGFHAVTKKGDLVTPECVALLFTRGDIVTMAEDVVQGGVPVIEFNDAKGMLARKYATFKRVGSLWQYCGSCFYRETIEP